MLISVFASCDNVTEHVAPSIDGPTRQPHLLTPHVIPTTEEERRAVGLPLIDDEFALISRTVPNFAGLVLDSVGNPIVLVVGDSPEVRDAAKSAAMRVFARHPAVRNRVLQSKIVKYRYVDLAAWRMRTEDVLPPETLVLTDIDEARNVLVIGVESEAAKAVAQSGLGREGVPRDAVDVQVVSRPILSQPLTLSDSVRPLVGGLKIERYYGGSCTLGFNARLPGDTSEYFVTNSHCTLVKFGADTLDFYQPEAPYLGYSPTPIGQEAYDPPYHICGGFVWCRYSDAALIRYTGGAHTYNWLGTIAKPTQRGEGIPGFPSGGPFYDSTIGSYVFLAPYVAGSDSLNYDPYVTLTWLFGIVGELEPSEASSLIFGQGLNKVGMKTGWTHGHVTSTGITIYDGNRRLYNQYKGSLHNDGGDSGAPIFTYVTDIINPYMVTETYLAGIVWGRDSSGFTYFSSLEGVKLDLGPIQTY